MGRITAALFWLAAVLPSAGCSVDSQAIELADEEKLPSIDLIPQALGPSHWPISTDNEDAQALFDQGMQLRWAYNMTEGARSMATARRADPNCAMCYWGEAFLLGSFLNGGMTAENAPYAHAAITRAAELAGSASDMERALIEAALVRYPARLRSRQSPAGR